VLETDGGRFHRTRAAIERDRRKEADLVRAGYRVLRCTWLQVQREPRTVAQMVVAALAA
jgi:very-short-patch-repair endonuclease